MHWSYWHQQFVSGALGPPAIYCIPQPHDLETIGFQHRPESPVVHIRSRVMEFSIPRSFSPVAARNSSGLHFYAQAPLFEKEASQLSALVEVNFGETDRPGAWLHKNDGTHQIKEAKDEYGLSKQSVEYLPSRRSPSFRPFIDYFSRLPDGRISTLISCDSIDTSDCMHTFYADGWTYSFHHSKKYLRDWRTMQLRLANLTRSFLTTEPDVLDSSGLSESHIENSLSQLELSARPARDSR